MLEFLWIRGENFSSERKFWKHTDFSHPGTHSSTSTPWLENPRCDLCSWRCLRMKRVMTKIESSWSGTLCWCGLWWKQVSRTSRSICQEEERFAQLTVRIWKFWRIIHFFHHNFISSFESGLTVFFSCAYLIFLDRLDKTGLYKELCNLNQSSIFCLSYPNT